MPDGRDWDDDQLLAALGEAMRTRREVPEWFVETGKNAYAWHNIDAELAQLTFDSSRDHDTVGAVRSEAASIRALTFTSGRLSIEMEVGEGSLLGQVIPPGAGTLEVHTRAGVTSSSVDEIGCFAVTPIPASPFRLRLRTEDGADVLTGWITL
jgi:isoaspartyl peptidase/L-asparaginase-like protein (Ntn-hydrolase superfamily)